MGGCVTTLVDKRNTLSERPHVDVRNARNYGPFSRPVPGTATPHSSAVYRNGRYSSDAAFAEWCRTLREGPVLAQRFAAVCAQRDRAVAFAYRPIEKVTQERHVDAKGDEKVIDVTHLRPRVTMTFRELWSYIEAFSRGLSVLQLPPRCHVSIYEDTRWEWLASAYAIWLRDLVVSTVYANLGEDALAYALRETASGAIICNGKSVPSLVRAMDAGELPPCAIVYFDELPDGYARSELRVQHAHDGNHASNSSSDSSNSNSSSKNASKCGGSSSDEARCDKANGHAVNGNVVHARDAATTSATCAATPAIGLPAHYVSKSGVCVYAWRTIVALGSADGPAAAAPLHLPTEHDKTALIMYTSGTTGNPKGVVHTHGSLTAGISIMEEWLYSMVEQEPDDAYCAYLPLAHILEFGVVNIFLARGCLIGFGSPRTLTDATARPHGDLREYKPSYIIGVPRIFDTVRKAIEARLPPRGTLKRRIFDNAYATRLRALKAGNDTPYYNAKVFGAVRALFGGRVRALLCGGGPLSSATQEFISVVVNLMVIGWGLTETVCIGAIQRLGDTETNCTGQVLVAEEMKLVDVDGYTHADTPEPRGEICVRGPFLFKGYYKQPELTRQVLDDDGWFHTGDVGSMTTDGKLRIVGRIKALAKNALGEYIALETLEALYSGHALVLNNCVCVVVNPYKHYIAALVLTDKDKAMAFAREHGLADVPYPQLLRDARFCATATESMCALATHARRKRFEHVKAIAFVDDEWTPSNGLLTAAMKLRRDAVCTRYAREIEQLFVA